MNKNIKPAASLQVADFLANPVWEYTNDDECDETVVRPVNRIPVEDLDGKIVGTRVQLANGNWLWASICNIAARNPRSTEQFLTLSVEQNGKWFNLSRYHDFDYAERGPDALVRFLSIPSNEVFPIHYDISRYAIGDQAALAGTIPKEPRERLSRDEIIAMAIQ